MRFICSWAAIVLLPFLTACNGGGSDPAPPIILEDFQFNGSSETAEITAENSGLIGVDAAALVGSAKFILSLPLDISSIDSESLRPKSIRESSQSFSSVASVDLSTQLCTEGSVISSIDTLEASGPAVVNNVFDSCLVKPDEEYIYSGQLYIEYADLSNSNTSFDLLASGFEVAGKNLTQSYQFSYVLSCLSSQDCIVTNIDIKSSDGQVHRFSDFDVRGDSASGYSGDGSFYHQVYGKVSFTIEDLIYGSCESNPSGGRIVISGIGAATGTISFQPDCSFTTSWQNGSTASAFVTD